MSLFWKLDEVVSQKGHDVRIAHGQDSALCISLRHGGYHSPPHIHDYEQINFIQEGEMWFFIHDKGYHVKKGDFLRIPRNAVHWSWVKTEEPCLCYEVFCPPPPKRKVKKTDRMEVALFDDGEEPAIRPSIGRYFVDLAFHGVDLKEVEARPAVNRS